MTRDCPSLTTSDVNDTQDHAAALEWYIKDRGPGPQHSDPFPEKEGE